MGNIYSSLLLLQTSSEEMTSNKECLSQLLLLNILYRGQESLLNKEGGRRGGEASALLPMWPLSLNLPPSSRPTEATISRPRAA